MLKRLRLEEIVLERLRETEDLPPEVSFSHEQTWYIGKEHLAGDAVLVLVGPSAGSRWYQEGHRTKRRSLFVSVRIVSRCDQNDAGRVGALLALSQKLLDATACMIVRDENVTAQNMTAEFDPATDPLDYERLANNIFFTAFSLEFQDQELFARA